MYHPYYEVHQQQLQEQQQPYTARRAHLTPPECFISTMHAAETNHNAHNSSDNNINK
jgi:hypothetical protein